METSAYKKQPNNAPTLNDAIEDIAFPNGTYSLNIGGTPVTGQLILFTAPGSDNHQVKFATGTSSQGPFVVTWDPTTGTMGPFSFKINGINNSFSSSNYSVTGETGGFSGGTDTVQGQSGSKSWTATDDSSDDTK